MAILGYVLMFVCGLTVLPRTMLAAGVCIISGWTSGWPLAGMIALIVVGLLGDALSAAKMGEV